VPNLSAKNNANVLSRDVRQSRSSIDHTEIGSCTDKYQPGIAAAGLIDFLLGGTAFEYLMDAQARSQVSSSGGVPTRVATTKCQCVTDKVSTVIQIRCRIAVQADIANVLSEPRVELICGDHIPFPLEAKFSIAIVVLVPMQAKLRGFPRNIGDRVGEGFIRTGWICLQSQGD
jgi:hypothetical protein